MFQGQQNLLDSIVFSLLQPYYIVWGCVWEGPGWGLAYELAL